ncbi:MAG TPA: hypothetical protein PLF43_07100 [Accumulibacter sp.]|nr:hypothetical protein [Accumulibacter sp.]
MPGRRLIYLTVHQAVVYAWQGGQLSETQSFPANESGHAQFARYLADHARSIYLLLANVAEEGFHTETIPFLRRADRRAIVERKLSQIFFNAPLATSLSLGYAKSRRKDERILLAALTDRAFLAPWLAAIAAAEAPLAGIHSLSLLGPLLLRALAVGDERCLLLSIQDQSIRQSYLENGRLHFSRLTPLHGDGVEDIAQSFASETLKLQQYLVSQRLLTRQQPITAYLLAHAGARRAIENRCIDTASLSFVILDSDETARKCKLKTAPADSGCEAIFLGLLANAPPREQFADDEQRHDYHLWLLRSILRSAGAAALIGCLLLAATEVLDPYALHEEIRSLQGDAGAARRRYDEIVTTFPPIPTTTDNLRAVIERYTDLERNSPLPDAAYRMISRALALAGSVELEAIEWKIGGASPSAEGVSEGSDERHREAGGERETIVVHGRIGFDEASNPRQVLHALHAFVNALRRNPGLDVVVLRQPFDVASGKSLKSSSADLDNRQPRVFSVRLSRAAGA